MENVSQRLALLSTWSSVSVAIWECYGTLRMWSCAGGNRSLGKGAFVFSPPFNSSSLISACGCSICFLYGQLLPCLLYGLSLWNHKPGQAPLLQVAFGHCVLSQQKQNNETGTGKISIQIFQIQRRNFLKSREREFHLNTRGISYGTGKRNFLRHIMVKILNIQNKRNMLRAARAPCQVT